MADEIDGAAPAAAPEQPKIQPQIAMVSQYVRDLSFENVAAQKAANPEGKPDVQVTVALDAKTRGEDRHEVVMKIEAKATAGDEAIFIAELEYAGVFRIGGVPDTHLRPVLLVECPRILFPFARRVIADVTRDGGFPPLMLDMVDFVAIYRQEIARRQAAQGVEAPAQGSA